MTQVVHPPFPTGSPRGDDGDRARFGGITRQPAQVPGGQGAPDFAAIQADPAFAELRSRFRRFVFPVSALFFLWYLTFVLLAAFARDLMATPVFGSVNLGLILGLSQFVSTIAITIAYGRFARTRLDPRVAELRKAAGR